MTKQRISYLLLSVTVGLLMSAGAMGQGAFRTGDRVLCDWLQNGKYEAGTVVAFERLDLDQSGRWYRVKLDNTAVPGTVECMATRLKPGPAKAASSGNVSKGSSSGGTRTGGGTTTTRTMGGRMTGGTSGGTGHTPPVTGNAPRSLPGTAWKIDYGRGLTGDLFLFCRSGRWEIVPANSRTIGAKGRKYTVSGSTLTTINADDGKVQKWRMSWSGGVLAINDSRVTLKLHYNGETQCK